MKPFERNKIIKTMEDVNRLAERLSKCPEVSRFNNGQHKEGWALADSFADIEGEFREFLDEQLPKLTQAEGEELSGLLFEIGKLNHSAINYIILEHDRV